MANDLSAPRPAVAPALGGALCVGDFVMLRSPAELDGDAGLRTALIVERHACDEMLFTVFVEGGLWIAHADHLARVCDVPASRYDDAC